MCKKQTFEDCVKNNIHNLCKREDGIYGYDKDGNFIYNKSYTGLEIYKEYDENCNITHSKYYDTNTNNTLEFFNEYKPSISSKIYINGNQIF